jgi:hypothetical protein
MADPKGLRHPKTRRAHSGPSPTHRAVDHQLLSAKRAAVSRLKRRGLGASALCRKLEIQIEILEGEKS